MKSPRTEADNIEMLLAPPDVHHTERQAGGWQATFTVAALVLIAESLLWYRLAQHSLSTAETGLLHGLLILLLYAYAGLARARNSDQRFAMLLFITTAFAGPFGAGGTMLAILSYTISLESRLSFEEWFASLFPKFSLGLSQALYEEIRSGRDESAKSYNIVPFLDIITFGTELQKRQALAKMAAHFYPGFAPAFKKALNDSSNMIRVQAATAIAKVEAEFQMRVIRLSALKEKHADDPRLLWALAELYDDYSHTGLIDIDREQTNRTLALEYYRGYLCLKPEDERTYTRIGRLLMRGGDDEKACDWFRQCIEQGKASKAMSDWYSEALFRCGRYEELRRWCESIPDSEQRTTLQPALAEALTLWKKGAAA